MSQTEGLIIGDIRIGEMRAFNFLPPYDAVLSNKTVYEVTKLYTLRSMLNDGFNPITSIYELYGMTEDDYTEDLKQDMTIVEFSLGVKRYYVPLDRIVSKAKSTDVHYSERLIGIKLGFIPDAEKLNLLMADIELLVKDMLGVESYVDDRVVSAKISITEEQHIAREAEREALRGDPNNYKKKYYNLSEYTESLLEKIKALETALLDSGANVITDTVIDLRGLDG